MRAVEWRSREVVSWADCVETAFQAILDRLPAAGCRSTLEPYATLIRALRTRGRSYREIVTILREHCGLRVATHTVYHFVQARAQKNDARRRPRRHPSKPVRRPPQGAPPSPPASPGPPPGA